VALLDKHACFGHHLAHATGHWRRPLGGAEIRVPALRRPAASHPTLAPRLTIAIRPSAMESESHGGVRG
jgi:hypothetical protein